MLVVHGVGDPEPGETLSLFARSVACHYQPLTERQEVLWLDEHCEDNLDIKTYAAHVRHVDFGRRRAVMAEVYWGDLSQVRRGVIGAITGLVELIFGLRYIAFVAASQADWAARGLQRLGYLVSAIVHGPVLAINFVLVLLMLTLAGTELLWDESFRSSWWGTLLASGVCLTAMAASSLGRHLSRNLGVREFWNWVYLTAVFISVLVLVKLFVMDALYPHVVESGAVRPGLLWFCRVLVILLGSFWLLEMSLLVAMAVFWFFACARPGAHRAPLHASFLLPAVSLGFWGFALPMMWLTAANGLRRAVALPHFQELFDEAVPMLGIQLLMMLVIGAASGIFAVYYLNWRMRAMQHRDKIRGTAPRLIVNHWLQGTMAGCTVLGVTLAAFIELAQAFGWIHTGSSRADLQLAFASNSLYGWDYLWGNLSWAVYEAHKYAVAMLAPLGFFLFMVAPHLRPLLDIALDIVNHFYFRPTRVEDALLNQEFDIAETTFESGSLFFARRDAIHRRVKRLLTYYRDMLSNRPTLTVISHSQGTVISVDVLNDPELSWLNSTFSEVQLVTMGSPVTHLYQHYFPHQYPPLHDSFWEPLRSRLSHWVNIYRVDDYVGTAIEFGNLEKDSACQTANYAVGLRGHLNYWTDIRVLEILRRELLDEPAHQSAELRRAA